MDTLLIKLGLLTIFIVVIMVNKNRRKQFVELMKTNLLVKYMILPVLVYTVLVIILISSNVTINPPQLLIWGLFAVMIIGAIIACIIDRKNKKIE
ncbi:MAG: hypothetical protein ACRCVG_07120 [Methanobacteriaceae archaeon]